eukprot:13827790-Ditylum_brightwellii.AAC.1
MTTTFVTLTRNNGIDPGATNAPTPHPFHSLDHYTNATVQELSERWDIGLKAATNTLKKTVQ